MALRTAGIFSNPQYVPILSFVLLVGWWERTGKVHPNAENKAKGDAFVQFRAFLSVGDGLNS